ncbi:MULTISPECIES: hypothetical protein [Flammeovirga]|uniref:Uncharacterized protein n=1 Tax=Flammeovirga agarivorans TaxID=2726742 RepID=A0A7X8XVH2_9BACT|nr:MULTISPECIES: hypothetical protein [Flammeovirga]NLR91291.1 hypothetical protein [Flammeovirga agarivorans]
MHLFVRISLIITSISLLTNCSQLETFDKQDQVYYFDLKEIIENTSTALASSSAKVNKEVEYDGKKNVISSDEIDWENELEIFAEADINRPIFKDSYAVIKKEEGKNHITRYEASGPRESVRWLELKKNTEGKILNVSFKIRTDNSLFETEKNGELVFDENEMLQRYTLKGSQSIVILGDKNYEIIADVVY